MDDNSGAYCSGAAAAPPAPGAPTTTMSDDDTTSTSYVVARSGLTVGGGEDESSPNSTPSPSSSSSPLPPPLSVVILPPSCSACVSQLHFDCPKNAEKKLRVLFSMCFGLTSSDVIENARILSDFSVEPYRSSKNKKKFKPTQRDMVDEVQRRIRILNLDADSFKLNNCNAESLKRFFANNKITDPIDVEFLRNEELKCFDSMTRAQVERKILTGVTGGGGATGGTYSGAGGIVFTPTADLRLIHCLIEDDVKHAFLHRHDCLDRQTLDARNSPIRPKTWLEQIADKFNDTNFFVVSEVFPNLHNDYAEEIDLGLYRCPGMITADQVKVWIADRKAKLVLLIQRWERSGNGDGQLLDHCGDDEDDIQRGNGERDFGNVVDIHYQGDDRSSFLKNYRPSLLYYWNMLLKYDILQETVSILPADLGVSSSHGNLEASAEKRLSFSSSNTVASASASKRMMEVDLQESNKRLQATVLEMMRLDRQFRDDHLKSKEEDRKIRAEERKLNEDDRKWDREQKKEQAKAFQVDRKLDREQKNEAAKAVALKNCSVQEDTYLRLVRLVAESESSDPTVKAIYQTRLEKALIRLQEAEENVMELRAKKHDEYNK